MLTEQAILFFCGRLHLFFFSSPNLRRRSALSRLPRFIRSVRHFAPPPKKNFGGPKALKFRRDFRQLIIIIIIIIFKTRDMSKSIQVKAGTTRQETALTVALGIHINTSIKQYSNKANIQYTRNINSKNKVGKN